MKFSDYELYKILDENNYEPSERKSLYIKKKELLMALFLLERSDEEIIRLS